MNNRYLQDMAIRRKEMRDRRNAYGSRGGYVSSRGGRRDRGMEDIDMTRGSGRSRDMHYEPIEEYRMRNLGHNRYEEDYNDYARGGRGRDRASYYADYADYADYGYDGRDYAEVKEEWKEDLEEWCKKLKKHDRFGLSKEDLLNKAKQMRVNFEEYDDKEFLTTYYMLMSDFPNVASDTHVYLAMAKQWLEDKDAELQGSEKLSAYYYEIVKGGK